MRDNSSLIMNNENFNKLPLDFRKNLYVYIKENHEELKKALDKSGLYIERNNYQITIHNNDHLKEVLELLEKL